MVGALTAVAAGLAAVVAYLVGLLSAAGLRRRGRPETAPTGGPGPRFLILVPARGEHEVIAATLQAISELRGPPEARKVVVIADHCHDRTASIAAAAGASVLERTHGVPAKGAALRWALD